MKFVKKIKNFTMIFTIIVIHVFQNLKKIINSFMSRWFFCTNHKDIGILYIIFGGISTITGATLSLYQPTVRFLEYCPQLGNVIISGPGYVIIFLIIMPILIGGFGNWFVPIMIGAPDVAFPRMNSISFWLLPSSLLLLIACVLCKAGIGNNWSAYPSLFGFTYRFTESVDFAISSLFLLGVSSILGAINFICTIFNMRAKRIPLYQLPLFVWSILITAFLMLLSIPVLAGAITMLVTDENFNATFFESAGGSSLLSCLDLFCSFGLLEVYILILPGFGIISHIIVSTAKKPIFGHIVMVHALALFGSFGFIAWALRMDCSCLNIDTRTYFTVATVVLVILTGIKIFSWLATLWEGSIDIRTPVLFALGFIFLFLVGVATEIVLVNSGMDTSLSDAYYVTIHFHYLLLISTVFSMFGGIYHWFDKITGVVYNEILGQIHFWTFFIGTNFTFFPVHFLGVAGMPRQVLDYSNAFHFCNKIASWGSYISAWSALVFFFVLYEAFRPLFPKDSIFYMGVRPYIAENYITFLDSVGMDKKIPTGFVIRIMYITAFLVRMFITNTTFFIVFFSILTPIPAYLFVVTVSRFIGSKSKLRKAVGAFLKKHSTKKSFDKEGNIFNISSPKN